MQEKLFIRIRPSQLEWMLLDTASGVTRHKDKGDWSQLGEQVVALDWAGDVVVLVPVQDVIVTRANLPSRKERVIQQALPFAVEEKVASDVETMHFAAGGVLTKGDLQVVGIERVRMSEWLDQLKAIGLHPAHMTVDGFCIPSSTAMVDILLDEDKALVRHGLDELLVVPVDQVGVLIELFRSRQEEAVEFMIHVDDGHQHELLLAQWEADSEGNLGVEHLDQDIFETLCRAYKGDEINLLQWQFKPQRQKQERGSWRQVAILAMVGLMMHFLFLLGRGLYFDYQAELSLASSKALYADVFPQDKNVRDMRRRWTAHLRGDQGKTSGGFFDFFPVAAQPLKAQLMILDNINFNEQRGDLVMQIRADSSDLLVSYSQTLQNLGLDAEIGTINQEDEQIRGSVRIHAEGGQR